MHSTVVRVQNVFGFFTTVAFVVAGLIALSDVFSPRTPSAKVSLRDVQVYATPSLPVSPQSYIIQALTFATESAVDPTTTPRKKKNMLSSDSLFPQTYPPSSIGIPNNYSSTFLLHGPTRHLQNSRTRRLFGIQLSLARLRITYKTLGRRL